MRYLKFWVASLIPAGTFSIFIVNIPPFPFIVCGYDNATKDWVTIQPSQGSLAVPVDRCLNFVYVILVLIISIPVAFMLSRLKSTRVIWWLNMFALIVLVAGFMFLFEMFS